MAAEPPRQEFHHDIERSRTRQADAAPPAPPFDGGLRA
jgi:hypothetical protein